METPYAALDEDAQVEVLRRVAVAAAEAFGLGVRHLALVLHAYNTTFRLDTDDGRRLALRVNTNSQSTPANIAAQQAWLHALARDTDVLVPDPVAAPGGAWEVAVDCPEWGGPLHATVASWLEGDDVGECDEEQALALGRTMALLHDHAEGFALPAGGRPAAVRRAALPRRRPARGRGADAERPRRGHRRGAGRCRAPVRGGLRRARPIVLHADLHGGNLKWHEGRLAVFDLDDAGFGVPALDLAISTFYLRAADPAVEAALRHGLRRACATCPTSPTSSSRRSSPPVSCCSPTACSRAARPRCAPRPPTTSTSRSSGCAAGWHGAVHPVASVG